MSFDEARAATYEPRDSVAKTAVLVSVLDPTAVTDIVTGFGTQHMQGAFYIVADGEGTSYGAERTVFERTHRRLDATTWVKSTPVKAYQLQQTQRVVTRLHGHDEADRMGQPGDWIVRQDDGETYVVTDTEFHRRYQAANP